MTGHWTRTPTAHAWPYRPTPPHDWTCHCHTTLRQRPSEDMGDWHVRIAKHNARCAREQETQ